MPKTNEEVEELLGEWAELQQITGRDPYRVRAYEKAARSIGGYSKDLRELDDKGILAIPNVGKNMLGRIREYLDTGTMHELEDLREMVPAGMRELLRIPGLGPKKAILVYEQLGVTNLAKLAAAAGATKTTIVTRQGLQVDLRVVPYEAWGAALVYFTGSKAHNIKVREIAVKKGLKLSEYGLFHAKDGSIIAARTEEEVYEALGLPWIPPTMREDRGEVEAALAGTLPTPVEARDLRGDLHTHTNLTDGLAPLEEMLDTASARGYSYYVVTDHAENLSMTGMTRDAVLEQRKKLKTLQKRYPMMTILQGCELNIAKDGTVDYDPDFLAGFDLLVPSVHS